MTTKTLGQVLYENDPVQFVPWEDRTQEVQESYEEQAQAVAAVVRERAVTACDEQRIRVVKTKEQDWFNAGVFYSMKAIRSMK